MQRYVAYRLLMTIPTLFFASILIFAIITLSPGDPARMMLGQEATEADVQAERARLGLDRPVPVRYAIWISDVAQLNLGVSQVNNRPVTSRIADAFPHTLRLTVIVLIVSVGIGFPLGIYAALHQNRVGDFLVTGMNSLGLAVPSFWIGIMLILVFGVTLRWLPPSGVSETGGLISDPRFLVMPVITLAASNVAVFSRFLRSSMIDVLGRDYIRTSRAKGLPERHVVYRHGLRNALLPVVTALGIQFGRLMGGAVVTETVFSYPGIGRLVVSSILNRDYPVVQATLILIVLVFLIVNIIVDLSYAYLDPTVKFQSDR